ncbi:hypothetical protein H310_01388 [Aphanomyces invadans]|uniref:Uncharacterized protein n=1 Tax=Aphanomyces invadans TaxID=157072 RepID=A0A024USJ6_9STRA|nr:hypothetical protein H310_01388 [Aphanomyces invadans]ETW08895.1 hypothetical protein H310_01388 [Aphanomyces invadans]|eukprot:XP_008862700.1 hypothetical protein H310_01388 [Aphanomyces invadans]
MRFLHGAVVVALSMAGIAMDCPSCLYQSVSCGNPASTQPVCDDVGLIQSDDVLCDGIDCVCSDGFVCASLRLGCPGVVHGGSRARCLSLTGLQSRYEAYRAIVMPPGPDTYPATNLSWVHFHDDNDDCALSDDCTAMRQLHACSAVLCGSAVIAWMELHGDEHEYRVVVEGTLADRSAGIFAVAARWNPNMRRLSCDSITATPIGKR